MTRSIWVSSLKVFAVDMVGKVLFWPLWWYTLGLQQLLGALSKNILEEEHRIGVGLWWRNLLVPMFGQSDWQGRIISFVMRLVVGLFRSLLFVLWFGLALLAIAIWVFGPPTAAYFLWRNVRYFFDVSWVW